GNRQGNRREPAATADERPEETPQQASHPKRRSVPTLPEGPLPLEQTDRRGLAEGRPVPGGSVAHRPRLCAGVRGSGRLLQFASFRGAVVPGGWPAGEGSSREGPGNR